METVGVAVIGGKSGVTVAVGGAIVAGGEIDGLGVIVAVALGTGGAGIVLVGVTVTTTGGVLHRTRANRPSARSTAARRIIGMYLVSCFIWQYLKIHPDNGRAQGHDFQAKPYPKSEYPR